MGILYSVHALDDEARGWFPLTDDDARSTLPSDAQLVEVARTMKGVRHEATRDDDGALAQLAFTRGDERTHLNVRDEDGRRSMYFEKGAPNLVYDVLARCADLCGPLVVAPDAYAGPALVAPESASPQDRARWGCTEKHELFDGARRVRVGAFPRRDELVQRLGLAREAGWLYFVGDGAVRRQRLVRGGERNKAPPELVVPLAAPTSPEFIYFIDAAGDVRRMPIG